MVTFDPFLYSVIHCKLSNVSKHIFQEIRKYKPTRQVKFQKHNLNDKRGPYMPKKMYLCSEIYAAMGQVDWGTRISKFICQQNSNYTFIPFSMF